MAADTAADLGMPMAELSQDTRAGLAKILPSFATTTNPVDITAALLSNSGLFGQILPVLAKDAAADAFLIGIPVAGQGYDVDGFAADSAVFARRTGKPLVTAIPQANIAAKFKAQGLPVFTTEAEAVSRTQSIPVPHADAGAIHRAVGGAHGRRAPGAARRARSTRRTAWR